MFLTASFLQVLVFGFHMYIAGMRESAGVVHWPSVGLSFLFLTVAVITGFIGVRELPGYSPRRAKPSHRD